MEPLDLCSTNETDYIKINSTVKAQLDKRKDGYYLKLSMNSEKLKQAKTLGVNTNMLGQTFISEAVFDNPDGSDFIFDKDFFGQLRNVQKPMVGPFENFDNGEEIKNLS